MSGRSVRRLAGPILEITVPIALLVLWGVWSASHATPSTSRRSPTSSSTFEETWVFERVGSDVVPSLVRLALGYVIAVVVAVAVGIPLGLSPLAAPRDGADRGVPARDPAAGAASVRDRRARRRQRGQGLPDRLRLRLAGAAEHDRRRHGDRPDARDTARVYGIRGRRPAAATSSCPPRARRSSPACAPAWRSR